jgi:hypothetical protein
VARAKSTGVDVSKKVNVNPDHYKVAGRLRQGDDVVQEEHRQSLAQRKRRAASKKPSIPQRGKGPTGRKGSG